MASYQVAPYNGPRLSDFAQKKAALDEIDRRRKIDLEAARRNMLINQLQTANTVQAMGELVRGGIQGQTTGLLQKSLESQASPEMMGQYRQQAIQSEQQGLQDYLMAPENQPDYQPPRKPGLFGYLQSLRRGPDVPRDYSEAQKGLLSTALAGEPIPQRPALDLRPPEQRLANQRVQADIEATQARGDYWKQGGYRGRSPMEQQAVLDELTSINKNLTAALVPYTDRALNEINWEAAMRVPHIQGLMQRRDYLTRQLNSDLPEEPAQVPDAVRQARVAHVTQGSPGIAPGTGSAIAGGVAAGLAGMPAQRPSLATPGIVADQSRMTTRDYLDMARQRGADDSDLADLQAIFDSGNQAVIQKAIRRLTQGE